MFSVKLERSILLRRVAKWKRRLKFNRILIGKPEFKHTNDKVIITLYIYNRELLIINSKIKNLKRNLIMEYFYRLIIKNKLIITEINIIKNILKNIDKLKNKLKKISKRKSITIIKKLYRKKKIYLTFKKLWNKFKNIGSSRRKIYMAKSLKRLEYSLNRSNNKKIYIYKYLNDMFYNNTSNTSDIISKSLNIIPKFKLNKLMYLKVLKKMIIKIRLYLRYNKILFFNKSKFSLHMIPLKLYLESIYKKKVEFNIVNIKNYNLDSNILTQIMAIKLKNKKNKVNVIIRKVLNKIKLPLTRKLQYNVVIPKPRISQNLIIKQLIKNNNYEIIPDMKIKTLKEKKRSLELEAKKLNLIKYNNDKLDTILKSFYAIEYVTGNIKSIKLNYLRKRNLENTTLDTIENKIISGVRIEASGRLSKRITAAKSMFKMKQKGTIRNINSSYKKLPSILLRGNFKSNLQYSVTSNKTRIGAFGIKGWVSSI